MLVGGRVLADGLMQFSRLEIGAAALSHRMESECGVWQGPSGLGGLRAEDRGVWTTSLSAAPLCAHARTHTHTQTHAHTHERTLKHSFFLPFFSSSTTVLCVSCTARVDLYSLCHLLSRRLLQGSGGRLGIGIM